MAAVRAKNTAPELTLRKYLHARGLRYRLHDKRLIGRPDLVFRQARLAVFVDGDFWHGAGWRERGLSSLDEQFPSRRAFWVKKIARNVERDHEVNRVLAAEGWRVIRVFASEISGSLPEVAERIIACVRAPAPAKSPVRPRQFRWSLLAKRTS